MEKVVFNLRQLAQRFYNDAAGGAPRGGGALRAQKPVFIQLKAVKAEALWLDGDGLMGELGNRQRWKIKTKTVSG